MLDELSDIIPTKVAGLVLDLSHQSSNGVSRIEAVKESLSEAFLKHWTSEDLVYITTKPDNDRLPKNRGEGLAWLSDFVPSVNMNAGFLLRHTTRMVAAAQKDDRLVVYVTDRYKPQHDAQLIEMVEQAERHEQGIIFVYIDIGTKPSDALQEVASKSHFVWLYPVSDPRDVGAVIEHFANCLKENHVSRNTEEDTQSQAAEPESVLETEGGHLDPLPRGVREGDEAGGVDPVRSEEQPVPDHADRRCVTELVVREEVE